jgi:RNA polymerase sigma-70 factor (ECF subfamily)
MTEEELVTRLKNSDKVAFSSLYDNYSTALYGVVMKIVRTDPPGADVMQDAFIKIWKNLGNYDPKKGTLFTWILNVARNTAIDRIRSSEYQKGKTTYDIDNQVGAAEKISYHNPSMEHIGVHELVNKLKAEHKEIIELAYFQGYTQTEIAEELNIPLGTVKTRVKLAMVHLRELTL